MGLRTHYCGIEREEKEPNTQRVLNPRPQEFCSTDVCSTAANSFYFIDNLKLTCHDPLIGPIKVFGWKVICSVGFCFSPELEDFKTEINSELWRAVVLDQLKTREVLRLNPASTIYFFSGNILVQLVKRQCNSKKNWMNAKWASAMPTAITG